MGSTVIVNNLTVVHKSSNGMVSFMPDVCKTPAPPAPPVPIPYPNIAMSQDTAQGSTSVKVEGNPIMLRGSNFSKSTGDEAGSVGGVASNTIKGMAEFINYAFDVKVEGKSVARLTDLMLGNKGSTFNTPPMAEMQPPAIVPPVLDEAIEHKPDTLRIKVVNPKGDPLKDVAYKIKKPDGTKQEGKLDESGEITIDNTAPGVGRIVLPDNKGAVIEYEE